MRRDESTTGAEITERRPSGNSLLDNYEHHDTGEDFLTDLLDEWGYSVKAEGIDMRHDDGADGVIYDDALDFRIEDDGGNVCGLVDVKTKTSPKWMGLFNTRHYRKYSRICEERGLPTFVAMFLVTDLGVGDADSNGESDDDSSSVNDGIESGFVYQFGSPETETVLHSEESDSVNRFPDGNNATYIRSAAREPLQTLKEELDYQSEVQQYLTERVRTHDD